MVSINFLWVASKVKKDDAEGLAALLDNLEETESWEDRTAASCDRSETYIDTITWCVYIYICIYIYMYIYICIYIYVYVYICMYV